MATSWLVSDRATQELLWGDLATHCRTDRPNIIPPVRTPQFHDFAVWEAEQLNTTQFADAELYWRELWARFENAQLSVQHIQGNRTPSAHDVHGGNALVAEGGTALSEAVRSFAGEVGVSPSVVFVAAYAALLRELTGRSTVAFWMPFPNRLHGESDAIVGWLSNFHLVGLSLREKMSARAVLEHCRTTLVSSQTHQAMPLPLLWRRMGRVADRVSARVIFEWRSTTTHRAGDAALAGETVHPPSNRALEGLHLTITDRGNDYLLGLAYPTRYFDPISIESYVSRYWNLVWRIVTMPDGTLTVP